MQRLLASTALLALTALVGLSGCGSACAEPSGTSAGATSLHVAQALRQIPPLRWLWSDGTQTVLHVSAEPTRCAHQQVRARGDVTLSTEDGRLDNLVAWGVATGSRQGDAVRWFLDLDDMDWQDVGGLQELVSDPDDAERGRTYQVDQLYMDLDGLGTELGSGRLETSGTLTIDGVDELARTWRRLGEPRPLGP